MICFFRSSIVLLLVGFVTLATLSSVTSADDTAKPVAQTISSGPIVIAHRGASGYLPEHTTEAAALAHGMGVDFIEQDVVLTKDGVPVVLHDVTLNSVTDVADVFPGRDTEGKFYVFHFTLQELKTLKVTERRTGKIRFPKGQGNFRIATLKEHLELIQGLNQSRNAAVGVYVELKQPALHREHKLDLAKTVLQTLNEFKYTRAEDNIFVQCFEEAETKRLRTELKCRLRLIQLYSKRPTSAQLSEISQYADGIGINIQALVDPASLTESSSSEEVAANDFVTEAHAAAMLVHAWTFRTDQLPAWADSADDLLAFLFAEAHVDGVFADQPDAAVRYLKKSDTTRTVRGPFHLLNGDGKQP